MKVIGMIFTGALARLLEQGRKTQTRRIRRDLLASARWQIGDLIWVREPWTRAESGAFLYAADYLDPPVRTRKKRPVKACAALRWTRPLYMPREAARLWLEVLDVRSERLQRITTADAKREGFRSRAEFFAAWARINGAQAEPDPIVWVVSFRRVEAPRGMQQQSFPGFL